MGSDIVVWSPRLATVGEDKFYYSQTYVDAIPSEGDPISVRLATTDNWRNDIAWYNLQYIDDDLDLTGTQIVLDYVTPEIDGITPSLGDLILVKNMPFEQNGIYEVILLGEEYVSYFTLQRIVSYDDINSMIESQEIYVEEGNLYAEKTFKMKKFKLSATGKFYTTKFLYFRKDLVDQFPSIAGIIPNDVRGLTWYIDEVKGLTRDEINLISGHNQVVYEIFRRQRLAILSSLDAAENVNMLWSTGNFSGAVPYPIIKKEFVDQDDKDAYRERYGYYNIWPEPEFPVMGEADYGKPLNRVTIYPSYKSHTGLISAITATRDMETMSIGELKGITTENYTSDYVQDLIASRSLLYPSFHHEALPQFREGISNHNYYCLLGYSKYTPYEKYTFGGGWSLDTTGVQNLNAGNPWETSAAWVGSGIYPVVNKAYYRRASWSTKVVDLSLIPQRSDIDKVRIIFRCLTGTINFPTFGYAAEQLFYDYYGERVEDLYGYKQFLIDNYEEWYADNGIGNPWPMGYTEVPKRQFGDFYTTDINVYLTDSEDQAESAGVFNNTDNFLGVATVGGYGFGYVDIDVGLFMDAYESQDYVSFLFTDDYEENTIDKLNPPVGGAALERQIPIRAVCLHIYPK